MKIKTTLKLRHQGVTPEACLVVEKERDRIYRTLGVLKPRYEIISEAILRVYGSAAGGI